MKLSRSKSPKGQAKGQAKKLPKKQSKSNVPKKVKGQSKLNKKKKPSRSSISRKKGSKKKSSKKKKTGARVLGKTETIKLEGSTCDGSRELTIDENEDLELVLQRCKPSIELDYKNMGVQERIIFNLKQRGRPISYNLLKNDLSVSKFIVKKGKTIPAEKKYNNLRSMSAISGLNVELEKVVPKNPDEHLLQEDAIQDIFLRAFPQLFDSVRGYPNLFVHIGIGSARVYCVEDKQFDALYNKNWIETKRQQIHPEIDERPRKELVERHPLGIMGLINDKSEKGKQIFLNINIDRTINGIDEPVLISYLKLKYGDGLTNENFLDIILKEYKSGLRLGKELLAVPMCLVHIFNQEDRLIVFVTLKANVNIPRMEDFSKSIFSDSLALVQPINMFHT